MTVLGYIDYYLNFVIVSCLFAAVLCLPVIAAVKWVRKRLSRTRQG